MHLRQQISGKFVTLTFSHMEMLVNNRMVQVGALHANMVQGNVKVILLKPVL